MCYLHKWICLRSKNMIWHKVISVIDVLQCFKLMEDGVTMETGVNALLNVTEELKPEHELVTTLLQKTEERSVPEMPQRAESATQTLVQIWLQVSFDFNSLIWKKRSVEAVSDSRWRFGPWCLALSSSNLLVILNTAPIQKDLWPLSI